MNKDTRELIIGLEWLCICIAFVWLARGVWAIARDEDGPVTWPIAGRYVLAATALSLALNALDIVRIRIEPKFLEPYWSSAANSTSVIVLRGVPVVLTFWLSWRIRNGGLVRGRASSAPGKIGEVVFMRRENDWKADA